MNIAIVPPTLTIIVLAASVAWSQDKTVIIGPDAFGREAGIKVLSAQSFSGTAVTGAPYSAEHSTRTTQTLADGNRIVNTSKTQIYRDRQGRTRVEQSLGGIGSVPTVERHTVVIVEDPVANAHYTLHLDSRTAEKVETNTVPPELREQMALKLAAEAKSMAGASASRATATGPTAVLSFQPMVAGNDSRTEEDLGVQTMEGLRVQGKRSTVTIPAGAIGNDLPISIVNEYWYSPELRINIMARHIDPRMGETVSTVTAVNRAEPDPSLFQVPADYQITDVQKVMKRVSKSPEE